MDGRRKRSSPQGSWTGPAADAQASHGPSHSNHTPGDREYRERSLARRLDCLLLGRLLRRVLPLPPTSYYCCCHRRWAAFCRRGQLANRLSFSPSSATYPRRRRRHLAHIRSLSYVPSSPLPVTFRVTCEPFSTDHPLPRLGSRHTGSSLFQRTNFSRAAYTSIALLTPSSGRHARYLSGIA